jgi:ubiquinone/menaquinone biosynthesis C-methylase UbiE
MRKGDFSSLAADYVRYRPTYNENLTSMLVKSVSLNVGGIKAADVGAGTGIFSKCLFDQGIRDIVAVEPNTEMREAGVKKFGSLIKFSDGDAENTGLESSSYDLVSMASSFHWPDTSKALSEFNRVLKPNGKFVAIWNPRLTAKSQVERAVQEILINKYRVQSRVSSGLSGITKNLTETLMDSGYFKSVVYIEAEDLVERTREEYIGAWRSVNDIQSQLGEQSFGMFLDDVNKIVSKFASIPVCYLTRAWVGIRN